MILLRPVAVPREPPLDPSAEEARQWALEELRKALYHDQPSIFTRLWWWLGERWNELWEGARDLGSVGFPLVVLALVALLIAAALLIGGPIRRGRARAARSSVAVLDADDRSADQLRAAADAAAAAGDHATAVLERFRAIVRSMDERAILEDLEGRTAREAAVSGGHRLPDRAADLVQASDLFDSVCYGDVQVNATHDAWMRTLDAEVTATRPTSASKPARSLAAPG